MNGEEVNEVLRRMRPFLVDKTFGADYEKYMNHLMEAHQRNLEMETDTVKIYRSQGRIEILKKLQALPEAVKDVK